MLTGERAITQRAPCSSRSIGINTDSRGLLRQNTKTLSPLVRIYQRLGINGPGCPTTARPGRFSSPEALFVLVACLDISSGRF
jgi:hypothetical protein